MHKKKGKWQASYKDTWCLDTALSPIIAAALRKFIEVERHGIPSTIYSEELEDGGVALWESHLADMLWAFENTVSPDVPNGLLEFVRADDDESATGPFRSFTIKVTDQEAMDKHDLACIEFEARRQKGLDLFAKYYTNLWD